MKNSYYFPHDYHARHDPKLEKLRMEIGPAGDGIYWDLVEMLYEEGGYLPVKNIPLIAKAFNSTTELVDKVVKSAELFIVKGDIFYSESALRRLKHIKNKTKKARENAEKRWGGERLKNPKRGFIFYVIRVWNQQEEFLKIGITSDSVSRRFSGQLTGYEYEILFNRVLPQVKAIKLEETISKECKKFTPSQKIGGYLECYDSSEKGRILSLMPRQCQGNAIKESKESKESKEKKKHPLSNLDFLETLKTNPIYSHINFDTELGKMDVWLAANPGRQKTRRFIVNWINKIEKPIGVLQPLGRTP